MSSTTIRVTPTSRGNFSKLRKYKDSNSIEKYETPANKMHKGVQMGKYHPENITDGWFKP